MNTLPQTTYEVRGQTSGTVRVRAERFEGIRVTPTKGRGWR